MKIKISAALRSITLIFVCVIFIYPQIPLTNSAAKITDGASLIFSNGSQVTANDPEAPRKLLIISDNQEHLLTGVPLNSMSPTTERWVTSVAMRSPLANVGGNLLFQEVLRFGKRENVDMTIHLGDASDISCPDEIKTVFDTLNKNMGNNWFMAMGNHDGILVGTHTKYQPPLDATVSNAMPIYNEGPQKGHRGKQRSWFNSCLSPTNPKADIMTKADAINLYLENIIAREKDSLTSIEDVVVPFKNGIDVPCKIKRINLPSQNYAAVARLCDKKGTGEKKKWVGPFASFLIQRIDIGGNRILLIDTSDYRKPNLRNVALSGSISEKQKELADELLNTGSKMPREKTIIAGHHPIDDFRKQWQKEWVLKRANRYMSGHVHRSAQLIKHKIKKNSLTELNIGSTLDYPTQAVVANISAQKFSFQVAGAGKTNLDGFLEDCLKNRSWQLEESLYRGYVRRNYISRVLYALEKAAQKHNSVVKSAAPVVIPKGDKMEDWQALEKMLGTIKKSEGESGMFWACQAYYASEATRREKSVLERFKDIFGLGTKGGDPAVGGRMDF